MAVRLHSYKPWYKRISWIILIALTAVLFGAGGWEIYKDSNPQSYVNFTQYAPGKIVDNLQVNGKTLEVWTSNVFMTFNPYAIDVVLSLNRSDSYISESKYKTVSFDSTCDGVNVDCFNKTTPNGQSYKLVNVYDSGMVERAKDKLTSEEVLFDKDSTRIQINIKSKGNTPITEKDWSDMIDSFKPTTFNDLRVKHMQPGP